MPEKKQLTLDNLAAMVARGFEETATKTDLKKLEEKIEGRMDGLEKRMGNLENKVDALPDKDFVIDNMGSLKDSFVLIVRKEDEKLNKLVEILKTKNVLTDNDLKSLSEFRVFPNLAELKSS
ncbi:MAG: hypothetical protein AB1465_06210 [Patescibacteria group bacterium]